jgi:hypothetical protein
MWRCLAVLKHITHRNSHLTSNESLSSTSQSTQSPILSLRHIPQAPFHTTNFNLPQHHIFTATIDTIGDAVDP